MKKILNIILFFSLVFGSCTKEKNFQHHEKGFEYMIVEKSEDGKQPKINDILVLDMKYLLNDDSLLFDSKELNNDFRMKRKKAQVNGSSIDDALCLLNLGDSAVFKINAIDFYTFTKRQNAPVGLKQSDEIYFYVRLKNVIDYDHFIEEKNSKELPNTKEEETKLLERYIKMSNIEVPPTNSGLYFIEDLAGQGELPQRGQIMTLNYLGYFINGESFSNTYETRRPFNVKLGEDDLISGFQEGLMKMKAKGHYTLVIPSHLAYGEEGTKTIPPNTTLIFEIDVISIQ